METWIEGPGRGRGGEWGGDTLRPGRTRVSHPAPRPGERSEDTHNSSTAKAFTYSAVGGQTQGRVFTLKKKKKSEGESGRHSEETPPPECLGKPFMEMQYCEWVREAEWTHRIRGGIYHMSDR